MFNSLGFENERSLKIFTEQKGISPTLQQCIDAGITLGINERSSTIWYEQYAPQGFLFSSGVPMTDLRLAMQRHKNNGTLAGLVKKASKIKTPEQKTKEQKIYRNKEMQRIRDENQKYLESKSTKALLDLKKDNGQIAYICGWLIDEIIATRKGQSKI